MCYSFKIKTNIGMKKWYMYSKEYGSIEEFEEHLKKLRESE